ncbi:MAG: hypothetical protein ACRDQE_06765 [Gaiellales bacterium]
MIPTSLRGSATRVVAGLNPIEVPGDARRIARQTAQGVVEYDSERKRMYVFGRRLHHGLTGAVFVAVGVGLMWHDRADRWWRAAVESKGG